MRLSFFAFLLVSCAFASGCGGDDDGGSGGTSSGGSAGTSSGGTSSGGSAGTSSGGTSSGGSGGTSSGGSGGTSSGGSGGTSSGGSGGSGSGGSGSGDWTCVQSTETQCSCWVMANSLGDKCTNKPACCYSYNGANGTPSCLCVQPLPSVTCEQFMQYSPYQPTTKQTTCPPP
jgi:hypothetical protein